MLASSTQRETINALRQQLKGESVPSEHFHSGLAGKLPGTFRRGAIVEWLSSGGAGAASVALFTAREACRGGLAFVVIDRTRTFYPPGGVAYGCTQGTIIVRPRSRKDELWAINQTLRCPGIGAVLCWPGQLEERVFRGLQIAAEKGGAVGLFVRPTAVRARPSWSDTQLLVEALPKKRRRQLRVQVVRSRSGSEGVYEVLELNDETNSLSASRALSLVSELASTARAAHPSGA